MQEDAGTKRQLVLASRISPLLASPKGARNMARVDDGSMVDVRGQGVCGGGRTAPAGARARDRKIVVLVDSKGWLKENAETRFGEVDSECGMTMPTGR
jgi:hypothetical protein